ncbi:hypothetical protein Moror_5824 [Moniliophthora roreri MCA 2997]|uniref:Uncharacterized protein n=1 Tax=Moniliophthora roreri (strain MCA 2997) TaxID=1381753 RepID=V2X390_MONRO|nr:hypothetical protein Moror_5824 [Moniliophthora roreri MCA 2997]
MRWIKGCRAVIIPREFLLNLSMNDSPTPHLPNGNLRLSHREENPFRPLLLLQLPFEKNLESSRKPKVSCKLGFASLFVLSGKPSLRVRKCGITEECDNRDGKVTVVGDAADPMLPHRGQGLDNTIQDKAMDVYEKKMWKCGREAVIISNENAKAVHDWERLRAKGLWTLSVERGKDCNRQPYGIAEINTYKNNGSLRCGQMIPTSA